MISVKIIIAGNGKVGAALTRKLSAEGDELTLIDSNLKVLESSEELYDIMELCLYGSIEAGGGKGC